ncbi:MAG TPA: 2-C-methyl-D-erythritol 2,4-cyclodiphosphate synthase [Pseudomonadales bacterium]
MRIGHGYDVHRFVAGDHVMIGGVKVPCEFAVEAHSDGDVLLHALCDALLGAAALGDIGRHFPDTSADYKNIDSRILLRHVAGLVKEKGYRLVNADMTVIAQTPKLAPYIAGMVSTIASDLAVDAGCINVKATTTERLGFVGEKKGLAAEAVVLIDAC